MVDVGRIMQEINEKPTPNSNPSLFSFWVSEMSTKKYLMYVVVLLVVLIVGYIMSYVEWNSYIDCNKEQEYLHPDDPRLPEVEWANVRLSIVAMMDDPAYPITNSGTSVANLIADPRIASFANNPSLPTNDMTDGGLITLSPENFVNGGTVYPPSYYLEKDTTLYYYSVDADGRVRGFLDENGEEEIVYPKWYTDSANSPSPVLSVIPTLTERPTPTVEPTPTYIPTPSPTPPTPPTPIESPTLTPIESTEKTIEIVEKGLLLRITTEKEAYGPEEPVRITMYAENISTAPIEYIDAGCGPHDFRVEVDGYPYYRSETVREENYSSSGGGGCMVSIDTLEPSDSMTRVFVWDYYFRTYPDQFKAPVGNYEIVASIVLVDELDSYENNRVSIATDIKIEDTWNSITMYEAIDIALSTPKVEQWYDSCIGGDSLEYSNCIADLVLSDGREEKDAIYDDCKDRPLRLLSFRVSNDIWQFSFKYESWEMFRVDIDPETGEVIEIVDINTYEPENCHFE